VPKCICDFPIDCDGSGHVDCNGCGGDFCICLACAGHGVAECEGCEACARLEAEQDEYDRWAFGDEMGGE
jgi:hypothetical protein